MLHVTNGTCDTVQYVMSVMKVRTQLHHMKYLKRAKRGRHYCLLLLLMLFRNQPVSVAKLSAQVQNNKQ